MFIVPITFIIDARASLCFAATDSAFVFMLSRYRSAGT